MVTSVRGITLYDDIQRIFDWMGRRQRNFFPKKVGDKEHPLTTQRSWDNFFWWLEIRDYPANIAVEPVDWPPASGNPLSTNSRMVTDAVCQPLATSPANSVFFAASVSR